MCVCVCVCVVSHSMVYTTVYIGIAFYCFAIVSTNGAYTCIYMYSLYSTDALFNHIYLMIW